MPRSRASRLPPHPDGGRMYSAPSPRRQAHVPECHAHLSALLHPHRRLCGPGSPVRWAVPARPGEREALSAGRDVMVPFPSRTWTISPGDSAESLGRLLVAPRVGALRGNRRRNGARPSGSARRAASAQPLRRWSQPYPLSWPWSHSLNPRSSPRLTRFRPRHYSRCYRELAAIRRGDTAAPEHVNVPRPVIAVAMRGTPLNHHEEPRPCTALRAAGNRRCEPSFNGIAGVGPCRSGPSPESERSSIRPQAQWTWV